MTNHEKGRRAMIERVKKNGHPKLGRPENTEKIRRHYDELARRKERRENNK